MLIEAFVMDIKTRYSLNKHINTKTEKQGIGLYYCFTIRCVFCLKYLFGIDLLHQKNGEVEAPSIEWHRNKTWIV